MPSPTRRRVRTSVASLCTALAAILAMFAIPGVAQASPSFSPSAKVKIITYKSTKAKAKTTKAKAKTTRKAAKTTAKAKFTTRDYEADLDALVAAMDVMQAECDTYFRTASDYATDLLADSEGEHAADLQAAALGVRTTGESFIERRYKSATLILEHFRAVAMSVVLEEDRKDFEALGFQLSNEFTEMRNEARKLMAGLDLIANAQPAAAQERIAPVPGDVAHVRSNFDTTVATLTVIGRKGPAR